MDPINLAPEICDLAREAGARISEIFHEQEFSVHLKEDRSPVTKADLLANELIVNRLKELTPNIPIVSEESSLPPYSERRHWHYLWLIDPLDGTKEFINNRPDFTVNIALIENDQPILGVIDAPEHQETYWAVANHGAFAKYKDTDFTSIHVHRAQEDLDLKSSSLHALTSRSLSTGRRKVLTSLFPNIEFSPLGSSLKFCWIAAGKADFYVRAPTTSEWDTAAGQCILEAAGGNVFTANGTPLLYNKQAIDNPAFVAANNANFPYKILLEKIGELQK